MQVLTDVETRCVSREGYLKDASFTCSSCVGTFLEVGRKNAVKKCSDFDAQMETSLFELWSAEREFTERAWNYLDTREKLDLAVI